MIGISLKQEIEHTFQIVAHKSSREELVFLCPECGDKSGHRSLNLKTGLTFCFRCNKGQNNKGNFLAWARALGYRFDNSMDVSTVPLEELLAPAVVKSVIPPISKVKMPQGFTPIDKEPNCVYTKLITKMAVRKNLDYDAFVEVGCGFTRVNPKWEAYAIFPVREYGVDVYYQGRTYEDVPGESTKLFPSKDEVKNGAAFWVYNIDELRESKASMAIVVESILNVLSLKRKFREIGMTGVVPVCVFKHHVSNVQILKILRCPNVQEVCLLFDHDAIDATWRTVGTMANKAKLTVAEMPMLEGNKKADANDDPEAAVQAIHNRRRYDFSTGIDKEREHIFQKKRKMFDMASFTIPS